MSLDDRRQPDRNRRTVDRRRVLAALASVTVGSVAGCSSVTDQEFEAEPVGLPEEAREKLALAETTRDSMTTTRQVEQIDGEVTITNQIAAYSRGKAFDFTGTSTYVPSLKPTLIDRFLKRANGTDGPGAAVVASGGEFGLDGGTMDYVDWIHDATDHVSLVVPAGARSGGTTASQPIPSSVMMLGRIANPSPVQAAITSDTDNPRTYLVDAKDFFPNLAGENFDKPHIPAYSPPKEAFARWFPKGGVPDPDSFIENGRVLIPVEREPKKVFGVSAEEMPGERIEDGKAFGSTNPFLIAAPGSTFASAPGKITGSAIRSKVFDTNAQGTIIPAPTRGSTFGMAVLSTPAAEVAGQSANPLAHIGFGEFLTSDQVRMIPWPSADYIQDFEWLSGPTPLSDMPYYNRLSDNPDGTTILDQETDLKSFLGVVSSDNGPMGLGIHMARVENEGDVVITGGAHSWPVGSPEYFDRERGERFTAILGSIIDGARMLTAVAGKQFAPGTRLS